MTLHLFKICFLSINTILEEVNLQEKLYTAILIAMENAHTVQCNCNHRYLKKICLTNEHMKECF